MQKYIPAALLILLGISSRLLPHPANFAPIAAIGIFSGLYLPKKFAIILPAIALFASDIVLGFYLWQVMIAVYISFAVTGSIGLMLAPKFNEASKTKWLGKFNALFSATLISSLIFFLVTNWAVWAFGTMYPHTLNGLGQSYVMALPFFKNTLLGDMFYTGVLVGGMEAILYLSKQQAVKKIAVRN